MDNRKVTQKFRMLAGVLLPRFKEFGDPFLVKVAEYLVDRTWSEGVTLTPDAWYALRLGTLRVLQERWGDDLNAFRFHLGLAVEEEEGDFDEFLKSAEIGTDEEGDFEVTDTFLIDEVIGRTKYEF